MPLWILTLLNQVESSLHSDVWYRHSVLKQLSMNRMRRVFDENDWQICCLQLPVEGQDADKKSPLTGVDGLNSGDNQYLA